MIGFLYFIAAVAVACGLGNDALMARTAVVVGLLILGHIHDLKGRRA